MMPEALVQFSRQLLRCAIVLVMVICAAEPSHADARLLIVSGLGGDKNYSQQFRDWALQMRNAAVEHLGMAAQDVTWLCESPLRESPLGDLAHCAGESRRETIVAAIAQLLDDAPTYRPLMVLLIGHGTMRDGRALFNVAGADLSARDLDDVLSRDRSLRLSPSPSPSPSSSPSASPSPQPATKRWVAIVNTTPASASFVSLLAKPARIVISATARDAEDDHTRFAAHFTAAYAARSADADRDGRVSLLEAFRFAVAEVAREYAAKLQLSTEHALLEDNADGLGSLTPDVLANDGAAAAAFFLVSAIRREQVSVARMALESEARELVARVHALRRRKVAMAAHDYELQLESLLVELALNRRATHEGGS